MKISVIGLGKLGYPMAEFLSSSGLSINCYDNDEKHVLKLKKKNHTFLEFEKGLEVFKSNGNDLNYFLDIQKALIDTDICFVTVPTPSNTDGSFSNNYILSVLDDISKFLKKRKIAQNPFVININSTVMPGSVDKEFIPFLEKKGFKNNHDFTFIYNPYYVALGDVISGLENPDLILIGCEDYYSKNLIKKIYNVIYTEEKYIYLNFYESELTKLLVNSYLTLKISFSNMVKDLNISNLNVDISKILNAVGSDTRVGKKFLKPGGPFSGPCLPRDTIALNRYSKTENYKNFLSNSVVETNKNSLNNLKLELHKFYKNGFDSITFCGIGYKSHTPSLEESFIIDLMEYCETIKMKVYYYDPYIVQKIEFGKRILENQIGDYSSLLFLPYTDKRFQKYVDSNQYVFDIWYQLNGKNILRSFDHFKNIDQKNKVINLKKNN